MMKSRLSRRQEEEKSPPAVWLFARNKALENDIHMLAHCVSDRVSLGPEMVIVKC